MAHILSLALTSFYLHYLICEFCGAMDIFAYYFMVSDVSSEEIVVKHDEVFVLGFFLVKMVIQTNVHYIC